MRQTGTPRWERIVRVDDMFIDRMDAVYADTEREQEASERSSTRLLLPTEEETPLNYVTRTFIVMVLVSALAMVVALCIAFWPVNDVENPVTPTPSPHPPASGPVVS